MLHDVELRSISENGNKTTQFNGNNPTLKEIGAA
jgi:hypothetical protein